MKSLGYRIFGAPRNNDDYIAFSRKHAPEVVAVTPVTREIVRETCTVTVYSAVFVWNIDGDRRVVEEVFGWSRPDYDEEQLGKRRDEAEMRFAGRLRGLRENGIRVNAPGSLFASSSDAKVHGAAVPV